MVHNNKKVTREFAVAAVLLFLFNGAVCAQEDPPARVARLNYLNGNVSMEPAGVDDWAPADLNRPFTVGDYLYADQSAAAELHLDVAVIRMGSQTSFGFLNLDDRTVQLKLSEGDLSIRIHNFETGQVFEIDTPNAAVTLLRDGLYRFRVDPNGTLSFVVVREGQAEITGAGRAFTLNADNSATLTGTDQLSYNIQLAPQPDEFDQWCQQRDTHETSLASTRYLPPTVIGAEDLGDYGDWQNTGDYGAVWYPRSVDTGWAPYHNGHWAWIDPWGWTWIDSMPWGFAPFHYGRWAYIGSRWGWCPGPIAVINRGPAIRPYYAPAMVAWFGGAHWGVGISSGGPSLGWVPLGWGELYTPSYRCSPRYFNNVNVYNTRVVNNVNITNVYRNVYINKTVYNQTFVNTRAPNAVMSMPQSSFASGRPVRQAGGVPVRAAEMARMRSAAVLAPNVAPTRGALLSPAGTRPAARPGAQVINRPVMARSTPPSVQPFVARTGLNQRVVRAAAPNVRQVRAETPVVVHPGQRSGAAASSGPASPVQPSNGFGRPTNATRTGVSGPAEQPAAQGVAPNRPAAPANERNQQQSYPRQQQAYPTQQRNAPVQPSNSVARPENGVTQPVPATHGVPPNSPNNSNGRFAERTPTGREASPRNTVAEQPRTQERSQRAPERAAPTQRQRPEIQERSQPVAPRQPTRPEVEQRSQSAPERRANPPQSQERSQPVPERAAPTQRQRPEIQERSQPVAPRQPTRPGVEQRSQSAPERRANPPQSQERRQPNRTEARPTAAPREEHRAPAQHPDHPKDNKDK